MHTTRLTAEERRDEVIAAAEIEFAAGGYAGTSTEAIARRAGLSQPYLFQLFRTKKEIFVAALEACFGRTTAAFEQVGRAARAEGLSPEDTLIRMGRSYVPLLLGDRAVLQLQLQAYAASCHDQDIRAAVRDVYSNLWQTVVRVSGASPQDVHHWFAEGMLINVIAAIDDARSVEEFDQAICGGVLGPS